MRKAERRRVARIDAYADFMRGNEFMVWWLLLWAEWEGLEWKGLKHGA